jgi:hypothetical protein
MALKNAFRASLAINGVPAGNKYWDAFLGGKFTQTETKYTPYDGVERTYVGKKETENITLEANYEPSIHGELVAHANDEGDYRGLKAEVQVFDLEPLSNPPKYNKNRAPYEGLVLEIVPPDGDSNDAGTIAKISLVVSVGSLATG